MVRNGGTYRVITDAVGSPRLVIDSQSGAIVDAITYDAWGRITSETAPGTTPFGFAGGLSDPETGLVHFGARDYDPRTGRWTASDPIAFAGEDANLYRYAGGDPVNHTDSTGLWSCTGIFCEPPGGGAQLCIEAHCSGGTGGFSCWGIWCQNAGDPGDNPVACVLGACSDGPGGVSCTALICQGGGGSCFFCSYGDTHLLTGDGVHVDFQAAGEFTGIESPNGKIDIQVRQQPWGTFREISFATAVAANVDGDRIGVYAQEPSFLLVNGVAINASDFAEQLPHGGTLERHGGLVTIVWPDGSRLAITEVGDTLNYNFTPGTGVGATLTGLLGSSIATTAPQLVDSDGSVLKLSDPNFSTKLYSEFANSWRITQAESLFHYWPGESTAGFTLLGVPSATFTSTSLSASATTYAEQVCRAVGVNEEPLLDDCILDVGATGDPAFAASEAAIAATGTAASATPKTGNTTTITLGQKVSGTTISPSKNLDYTFLATAGEIVYLKADGACVTGLSWALLNPTGGLSDFDPTCKDLGREVLPTTGVWTVQVSQAATSGAFSFTVLPVPAPTLSPISLGQEVKSSISQIGEVNDYTFVGSAGQVVYLKAQGACVSGLGWTLLQPDGGLVDFSVSCSDMGRQVLPSTGVYTVQVAPTGTATGAYAFTVEASQ
jgi:RHS repeat-associated protein